MKTLSSRTLVCHLYRPLAACGLLLATAGAAHAQTRAATFAPAATYGTGAGSNPISVVAADVNGDGQLDLLTANYGNGTAGVLLGSGNGTFQPIVTYNLGSDRPYGLVAADVNGDGKLDLLTANYGNNAAGVLLGNGNGTFQPIVSYSTGTNSQPTGIAVADVNGDGQLDLLIVNGTSGNAGVLLGNGNGTFQPIVTYGTGGNVPRSIAVADVNGDSKLDLLLTNEFSANAGVLLGNGNGTFQPAVTYGTGGSNPTSIVVADVSGDGKPDLLTANHNSANVGVLLGNGNGTFQPVVTYGAGGSEPQTIAVADVNGDGRPDLLTANSGGDAIGVLLGDGPGTFQPAATYGTGGNRPYGLVAADVNGDGKPDLLTTNFVSNTAAVLLNTMVYAPIINAVTPMNQYIGQSITLTGTNLTGATAVLFNGTPATFVVVSATTIRATIPAGVRPAVGNFDRVTVTTPNGTSNAAPLTILANAPTVSTTTPSSLSASSATLGGNVTTDGGADISDRGVVYSSSNSFPFLGDPGVRQQTMGMGPFSQLITGLTPGTTYYVRAYATNRSGTSYGIPRLFTTACQVPVLTQVPPSQTVAAEPGQCTASVSFQAQASGVPAPTLTYTLGGAPITSPYTFPLGQSTVTVTATSCGGSVTGTFTVTVQDTQAPVVRIQNVTVALVNGQATITAAQVDNGSSDNCTIKSVTVSPSAFSCTNSGANQVTLTVTDASGNVSTGPATVTVTGNVPQPAISVSPSSTIYLGYGPQSATLTASGGGNGATYQWSPATGLSTTTGPTTTFTATAAGNYPITVSVTSASGCSATATVTLTVVDARCGNKNDKVVVCHNGQLLCVAAAAVDAHLGHGDQLGNCSSKTSAARTQAVASSALSPEPELTPLLEAYPNPFTSSATVRFRADQDGAVRVVVYNVLGQPVATLYDGAAQAGQIVERTLTGTGLSNGLYTIRLSGVGGQARSQRLMLTK